MSPFLINKIIFPVDKNYIDVTNITFDNDREIIYKNIFKKLMSRNNYKLLMEFRGNVGNVINDFRKDRYIERTMGKEYDVSVIIDGQRKIVFQIKSKNCIVPSTRWRFYI